MKRRRVLLGTPVYGDVTVPFYLGAADMLRSDVGVDLIPSVCAGTYVMTARDNLVLAARKHECEEILFVDADVKPDSLMAARILSHDVDIVGGVYAKRVPGEAQWTSHATGEPPKGDLLPCSAVAGGFLRVKMTVFDAIDRVFAHRRYQHPGEPERIQYFPVNLVKSGCFRHPAEAKLEAIAAILDESLVATDRWDLQAAICRIIDQKVPCEVTGDDVSFCRLAKAAGFTVWADLKLHLRHHGDIGYPAQELPL